MNIYIATKFENQEAFHEAKKQLEDLGHRITHDWTTESPLPGESPMSDRLAGIAQDDLLGVCFCDVLLLLAHPKMAGAFSELGIAIGMGKSVVIVDAFKEGNPGNIFYALPGVIHADNLAHAVRVINHLQPPAYAKSE